MISANPLAVISAFFAIAVLIILVGKRIGLHPMLALLLVSVGVGWVNHLPAETIVVAIKDGSANSFTAFGFMIVLGAIFGKFLVEAKAIEKISTSLISVSHPYAVMFTMTVLALLVGLPLFFEAALIIMLPIIVGVAIRIEEDEQKYSAFTLVIIPVFITLLCLHGLMPPHPGPTRVAQLLNAHLYQVMLIGFLIAAPIILILNPLCTLFLSKRIWVTPSHNIIAEYIPSHAQESGSENGAMHVIYTLLSYLLLILPILLITPSIIVQLVSGSTKHLPQSVILVGNPIVALLLSTFVAMITAAIVQKEKIRNLNVFTKEAISSVAGLIILLSAGGALSEMLYLVGISHAVQALVHDWNIPIVLLAWILAALLGVASGSATVATMAAAQLTQGAVAGSPPLACALITLAIACGSIFFGYTNHGSYWMMKDSFGLTLGQTTIIATGLSTLISISGLIIISTAYFFLI